MRLTYLISASLGLAMTGGLAMADGHSSQGPRIYAYKSSENYCPTGLQPVTISGVICCGVPNQKVSYQQMLAHGTAKRRHISRAKAADCPIGTKGCTFD